MRLRIEKMIYGGEGLARIPADRAGAGKAIFVPFVLPGEEVTGAIVEEKPGFARARTEAVLKAAPQRVEPRCPYFQRCGGCHYQHASYEEQLAIKAGILQENLRRIGKIELASELQIHPSPPWNYRNRTRLRLQTNPQFALGYYRFNSHDLLPVEECPISSPLINRAIAKVWDLGRAGCFPEGAAEIELFANSDDGQLLVEVVVERSADDSRLKAWAQEFRGGVPETVGIVQRESPRRESAAASRRPHAGFASQKERKGEVLSGAGELRYEVGEFSYRVSAGSFFQVNRHLTSELIQTAIDGQTGKQALDLYAGVGLFSLALAQKFDHILAVESSQSSFSDLRYNAPARVKTVRATVEQYVSKTGFGRPDFLLVDPPRGGLGERLARKLAEMRAPSMSYISCDPATLARDLKIFVAGGYRIQEAHLMDLFPQTFHLESVLQLTL